MHIGLSRPKAPAPPITDVDAAFVAKVAEAAGFESIFFGEHPITPLGEAPTSKVHTEGVPYFQETVVALSRVSAATTTIRFGFGVCILPEHQPVRLAKQLACLDHYSGGRLMIGVGTGWSQGEYQALGARFDRRWGQVREAIGLIRELWTKESVEHHGEFYDFPAVRCFPQPAQKPGPPFLMGASYDTALQRMVDYCDGWLPAFVTPEQIAAGPETIRAARVKIAAHAATTGRDVSNLPITAILRGDATRDDLKRYEDAGVERVAISLAYYETEDQARRTVETLAAKLLR